MYYPACCEQRAIDIQYSFTIGNFFIGQRDTDNEVIYRQWIVKINANSTKFCAYSSNYSCVALLLLVLYIKEETRQKKIRINEK